MKITTKGTVIRQYGETTGMILIALGKALHNPTQRYYLKDDDLNGDAGRVRLVEIANEIINLLKLENVKAHVNLSGIYPYLESKDLGLRDGCGGKKATLNDWKNILPVNREI